MIASKLLLSLFVDLSTVSDEQIVNALTFSGLEVENSTSVSWGDNIAVGFVKSCIKHPSSDHLHITQIEFASGITKQIVCGAPNMREGIKVIVALEGCYLPAIDVKIKASKIRNEESNGMCCSLLELGIAKEELNLSQIEGIEILPDDFNMELKNREILIALGLDDTKFDVNVLANRPDCLSIFGLANEIANLLDLQVIVPDFEKIIAVKDSKVTSLTSSCPQIGILYLNNVTVSESPEKVKSLIRLTGMRPINLFVDVANLVMKLFGQPLHMYDLDKCGSESLIATDKYEGSFIGLDNKEYKLKKGDIVITSEKGRPLCLAGILGSKDVTVDQNSKNIAIESAVFYHAAIRRTSARLGLSSDASSYFFKGVNVHQNEFIIATTYRMIKALSPKSMLKGYYLFDTIDHEIKGIVFSSALINKRLGSSYGDQEIISSLEKLNIRIEKKGKNLLAYSPSLRQDISTVADLSEEIFRTHSSDDLNLSLSAIPSTVGKLTPKQKKIKAIKNHLIELGLDEVLTYTLVGEKELKLFNVFANEKNYQVINPMTEDHQYVRNDLLASLCNVVTYNLTRNHQNLALFEVSEIDMPTGNKTYFSIAFHGSKYMQGQLLKRPYSFFDLKGIYESLIEMLGIPPAMLSLVRTENPSFHPGVSCEIRAKNKVVGVFGKIYPGLIKNLDDLFLLEIDLTALFSLPMQKIVAQSFSIYPSIIRDLAFTINKSISCETMINTIKKVSPLITSVDIFDIYEGKELAPDQLSCAYKIEFSDATKTLKDEEIAPIFAKIIAVVEEKLGGKLR